MNWVVMVVRAGKDITRRAIDSVFAQDIGDINLLVVLNGPSEAAQTFKPRNGLWTLAYPSPRSLSYCWNQALSWVFTQREHCLVVNNDIELRPDTYRLLNNYLDYCPFITAVGNSDRKFTMETRPTVCYEEARPHPDFSCFLINKWAYEKVGPFDEQYVGAYGEDADYHIRMHRAGIRAISINVPFYHVACGTMKSMSYDEQEEVKRLAQDNRNRFKTQYGCEIGSDEYYGLFR